MLTRKLSGSNAEDAEADGQEYARALDTQGEVEQYMQAYCESTDAENRIAVSSWNPSRLDC